MDETLFYFPSGSAESQPMLAFGVEDELIIHSGSPGDLDRIKQWLDAKKDWVFGYISYDLKNSIEKLASRHENESGFPLVHFIRPKFVASGNPVNLQLHILKGSSEMLDEAMIQKVISRQSVSEEKKTNALRPRLSKSEYVDAVQKLMHHIQQGDIYEINFCQEFFSRETLKDPYHIWHQLRELTQAPFSAFMQSGKKFLMCASPERFLKKEGNKVISQPIKGTIKRGSNIEEDKILKNELHQSKKERAENIMIVDLVRNDLSKSAVRGSVQVEELCGVHTFKTVHHLISTISAEIKPGTSFTQIFRDTFPMGSMTGAPKIRAMQLIDKYESSRRGIYSGSIGYITPEGDFDFNVIIRSLVCNNETPFISYSAGSAITALSDPEKEYEECLLKAEAMMKALL